MAGQRREAAIGNPPALLQKHGSGSFRAAHFADLNASSAVGMPCEATTAPPAMFSLPLAHDAALPFMAAAMFAATKR